MGYCSFKSVRTPHWNIRIDAQTQNLKFLGYCTLETPKFKILGYCSLEMFAYTGIDEWNVKIEILGYCSLKSVQTPHWNIVFDARIQSSKKSGYCTWETPKFKNSGYCSSGMCAYIGIDEQNNLN